jgi:hypothetical protein
MDIFSACIIAAALFLMEARSCKKRQIMWIEMGELEQRIADLEKRKAAK